jgi:hypothetical protein
VVSSEEEIAAKLSADVWNVAMFGTAVLVRATCRRRWILTVGGMGKQGKVKFCGTELFHRHSVPL